MKKVLLFLFAFVFATDSFASGIGNVSSASCDNETLAKYTGTADVEINWEPNTIGLKWYNGDQQISGQTSCVYDGTITVPPQPTKFGYTFNGWKVIHVNDYTCGIDRLDASIDGVEEGYTYLNGNPGEDEAKYGLIRGSGQWAVEFDYGVVYGNANCNAVGGWSYGGAETIDVSNTGKYCWCQATGFVPVGNDYSTGPKCDILPVSSLWVFRNTYEDVDNCARYCAAHCTNVIRPFGNFRRAVFEAAGQ